MRFFINIGLTVLLTACGQAPMATSHINLITHLTPAQPISLVVINGVANSIDDGSKENVTRVQGARTVAISFSVLPTMIMGNTTCLVETDSSSCTIEIDNDYNPDLHRDQIEIFASVVRHELGHSFGMGHIVKSESNVMYPFFILTQITPVSIHNFLSRDLKNFRLGLDSSIPDMNRP